MEASSHKCLRSRPGYWCDVVYSPDDGGWYLQEVNGTDSRVSKKIYRTEAEARRAYESERVRWTR